MSKTTLLRILNLFGVDVKRFNNKYRFKIGCFTYIRFNWLFEKYKKFTMIAYQPFVANLDLCDHFKHLEGDYVECGVWRGGMSAAIAELLGKQKTIHLLDSFEGLPPAKEIDGKEALSWQKDVTSPGYYDNCKAEMAYAEQAMGLAKHKQYKVYKGWFDKTLPDFGNHPISILRLDGDWYDSIMVCLDQLFPQVVEGGIILLDDYYSWDGCAKAVHDYLSKTKSPSRVYQWNDRIAYIIKKN